MKNPFRALTRTELIIWISSLIVVTLSFVFSPDREILNLCASLIGVTALIFVAKGYVFGQILVVVFSLFYGYISLKFHYYGEVITYLGMSAPMAIAAVVSWIRHPYKNTDEVKVSRMKKWQIALMIGFTVAVTVAFYFILGALGTTNLLFSTLSVATSFLAAFLTYMRSPYYGLAYGANDVVLIVLWVLAAIEDISYLPMIFCFVMFLVNDIYGFCNWRRMRKRQES